MEKVKKERNYSIDLLRIIAMLMVVAVHFCTYTEYTKLHNAVGAEALVLQSLSVVAVNCYVLITGYFMCEKEFSLKRLTLLWSEMFFYSVATYIICSIAKFETFSMGGLFHALLPFTFKNYWFIHVYILLIVFSPILNAAINNLSKSQYKLALLLAAGC